MSVVVTMRTEFRSEEWTSCIIHKVRLGYIEQVQLFFFIFPRTRFSRLYIDGR